MGARAQDWLNHTIPEFTGSMSGDIDPSKGIIKSSFGFMLWGF